MIKTSNQLSYALILSLGIFNCQAREAVAADAPPNQQSSDPTTNIAPTKLDQKSHRKKSASNDSAPSVSGLTPRRLRVVYSEVAKESFKRMESKERFYETLNFGRKSDLNPDDLTNKLRDSLSQVFPYVFFDASGVASSSVKDDLTMTLDYTLKLGGYSGQKNHVELSGKITNYKGRTLGIFSGSGSSTIPFPASRFRINEAIDQAVTELLGNLRPAFARSISDEHIVSSSPDVAAPASNSQRSNGPGLTPETIDEVAAVHHTEQTSQPKYHGDVPATKESAPLQSDAKKIFAKILSPLHEGNIQEVESILKDNPELLTESDNAGNTILHVAALGGSKEVVEFLLGKGCDVTLDNNKGQTALAVAESDGKTEAAEVLRVPTEKAADQAIQEGLTAAQQQNWSVAIKDFTRAQAARPTDPKVLYNLGLAESKVPGREMRAMAWLKAYLAADPDSQAAAAVRDEITSLKVRAEALVEQLFALEKQQAAQMNEGNRKQAFSDVAIAQARSGDVKGSEQTLANAGLGTMAQAKKATDPSNHYKGRFDIMPSGDPPSASKDQLAALTKLIKGDMNSEIFTDPQLVLQSIAAKSKPEYILVGTVIASEQLSDTLTYVNKINP